MADTPIKVDPIDLKKQSSAINAKAAKQLTGCVWNGTVYPENSYICANNQKLHCELGSWNNLGESC